MKVSIIGGGGRVGSNAAFALQCAGIVSEMHLLDANENSFGPSIPTMEETTSSFHHDAASVQSALDFKQLRLHRYPDA